MSTPQETIQNELKTALKAGDKERLGTLRMLLGEVKNEKIRLGREVDDDAFVGLVRKSIKQRQDAAAQYRQGNRPELAEKEEREAAILQGFMPAQVGEEEIRRAVAELVAQEGLSGPKGIGPVMKAMLERFGSSADGKTVNRIAREVLG